MPGVALIWQPFFHYEVYKKKLTFQENKLTKKVDNKSIIYYNTLEIKFLGVMKVITAFGKFLRVLRMDNEEILKDMAEKLDVTSSFLSAVENGKKKIPGDWLEKISDLYSLSNDMTIELQNAISETNECVEIKLTNLSLKQRELAFSFARKLKGFDENEIQEIWQLLNEEQN